MKQVRFVTALIDGLGELLVTLVGDGSLFIRTRLMAALRTTDPVTVQGDKTGNEQGCDIGAEAARPVPRRGTPHPRYKKLNKRGRPSSGQPRVPQLAKGEEKPADRVKPDEWFYDA